MKDYSKYFENPCSFITNIEVDEESEAEDNEVSVSEDIEVAVSEETVSETTESNEAVVETAVTDDAQ